MEKPQENNEALEDAILNSINLSLKKRYLPTLKSDMTRTDMLETIQTLLTTTNLSVPASYQDHLDRLMDDHRSLQMHHERIASKLEQTERNSFQIQRQLQLKEGMLQQSVIQANNYQSAMEKCKMTMEQLKKQYSHDSRRREKEMERLKDKVDMILAGKMRDAKISVVSESFMKKPVNFVSKGDKDGVLQMAYEGIKTTNQELMRENELLKNIFKELYTKASQIYAHYHSTVEDLEYVEDVIVEDAQFDLPLEWTHWERSVKAICEWMEPLGFVEERLKAKEDEVSLLKQELEEMRLVLEQQQLSIQEKPNQVEWDFELQKEKEKLENERKTFMESAIKLGKERAAFLKEKEEFEKKKNEKNVEQPATPQWLQSMIQKNPLKGNLMFSPIVDKKLNSFKENPFKESSLKENPFKEISFKENPFKENVDPSEETF